MKLNRRFFLKSVGLIGGASLVKNVDAVLPDEQVTSFGFSATPYLQNFTKDTVTICCVLNRPCLAWVEILDGGDNIKQVYYQVEDGMRNANATLFKFKVPHEDQNLRYRVKAKEVTKFDPYKIEYGESIGSEIISTALPLNGASENRVLILNDIHENVASYSLLYNKSVLARKDLVILNGDMFHYVTKQSDLTDKLLQPVSTLFAAQTPFVMVRGNHETRGSFARDYKRYFDYPDHKYYQAFTLGDVFWIILDGGEDKPDTHEVYAGTVDYDQYRLEQREWLQEVIRSKERKKAKHTIVVNHIPFLHSDEWHGTAHNRACFHDILQKNKIDALISGHTHKFAFHPPDAEHNYYVVIGGGPREGGRTFVEVVSSGKKLSVELKKEDGSLINSFAKK